MRKPRLSKEDIPKGLLKKKASSPSKSHFAYSIDSLAHLAMSPLCLAQPDEWERITQEYPDLIRNVSICFLLNS